LKDGIILFGHGSREPEWAQPLESIARELSGQFVVELAYLERMKPTLDEAVDSVVAKGAGRVRIVPVFLGVGGHLKTDLPRLSPAWRARAMPGSKSSSSRQSASGKKSRTRSPR